MTEEQSSTRYFGDFESVDHIKKEFDSDCDGLEDSEVLIAIYDHEPYEGMAIVVFKRDGKLYEAHGEHCSCYELEGQWEMEETSLGALKMRDYSFYDDLEKDWKAFLQKLEAPDGLDSLSKKLQDVVSESWDENFRRITGLTADEAQGRVNGRG